MQFPSAIKFRGFRYAAIALMLMCVGAHTGRAEVLADVEFDMQLSPSEPHPTTYKWAGEDRRIMEPGVHFYTFYYTGTVHPDARVPQGIEVKRIPVSFEDWVANRQWIINKLTFFFEITRGTEPTAAAEVVFSTNQGMGAQAAQAGQAAAGFARNIFSGFGAAPGAAPGGPAGPGATGYNQPGAFGPGAAPGPGGPGSMSMEGFGPTQGQYYGSPQNQFAPMGVEDDDDDDNNIEQEMDNKRANSRAQASSRRTAAPRSPQQSRTSMNQLYVSVNQSREMAKWTFFYDQLVLWQYYCTRNLLNDPEDQIIESNLIPEEPRTEDELIASLTGQPLGPDGQPLTPGTMAGGAGAGQGMQTRSQIRTAELGGDAGVTDQQLTAAREIFLPMEDYQNPERVMKYRETFEEKAQERESNYYQQFINTVNQIRQQQENQNKFEAWLQTKQQDVADFAETWRKVEEGEALIVEDQLFLVTQEPLQEVPSGINNVVMRERVTPQDLLNEDGTIKKGAVNP